MSILFAMMLQTVAPTGFDQWLICVKGEAARLEPSGESADNVADAAMALCRRYEVAVFDNIEAKMIADGGGATPLAMRTQFRRDVAKDVRGEAVIVVVEKRAAR